MAVAPAGKVYVYYACAAGIGTGIPADLTKVQAAVDIAGTQAYNAIYTVPRNKNLYLTSLRFRSYGALVAFDVDINVIRKVYGGSDETVVPINYANSATATTYTDDQVQLSDKPILFPAKSIFRVTAGLAGGTALNLAMECNFIEEDVVVTDSTVDVIDKAAFIARMALTGAAIASQNYWLIGLDEEPAILPTTAILDDVLATITGTTSYKVAADTEVAFDPAYFVSGKLVITTKKAVLTLMRCITDASVVYYVLAPTNTVFSLGSVKKMKYLA
jgi:hypothetical protein